MSLGVLVVVLAVLVLPRAIAWLQRRRDWPREA